MFIDYNSSDFEQQLDGLDKSKTYLVYCRSGNRSGKACHTMLDKGFKQVYNLDGGISAWSDPLGMK
jgi:rhodanese-related sulfurtransferase